MGYNTRPGVLGHTIRTFWPDDNETTIYICDKYSRTLAEIQQIITDKWPDADAEDITISSQKIHTDCLGYDLYDAGDYTDFVVITRIQGA